MIGVGQLAVFVFGHGVDGQVAADQVFFQGDIGAGMENESAVAAAAFALCASQCVLLPAFGMEKYRKVGPYRAITQSLHLFGSGADHHPIDISDWLAEQAIAYRAADFINLHKKPPLAQQDTCCAWPAEVQLMSQMDDSQVQSSVVTVAVIAFWRHVVSLHHLVALQGFQMNIEAPQAVQVLEHFLGGVTQWFAVMLLVAQGQGAIAAPVDTPDLHVGFAVAQVVLGGQGFADYPVAFLVVDGRHQQIVALIVIEDAEQLQVADHLG
ncbi:hypothetical protein D3C86_1514390 [compost metagenome]